MKEETIADIDLKDPKMYELGFLLSPLVAEDDKLEVINKSIIVPIESRGGAVTGHTPATMRKLAYTMSKSINHKRSSFTDAYFGAVRFNMSPDQVVEIQKEIEASDVVIRTLLIQIPPRSEFVPVPRRIPEASDEAVEADTIVDTDQIDTEIDELLEPTTV